MCFFGQECCETRLGMTLLSGCCSIIFSTQTGEASVEVWQAGAHLKDPSRWEASLQHTPAAVRGPNMGWMFSGATRSILCPAVPWQVSLGDLVLWLIDAMGQRETQRGERWEKRQLQALFPPLPTCFAGFSGIGCGLLH